MRRLIRLLGAAVLAASGLLAGATAPGTPAEHRRTPDQTFLTFPEWFLVHSPAEYADWLSTGGPPSEFPLFSHVGQFWQSYGAINREIRAYPFNGGYHLMVMVIGVSTSVEYALKGVYEHTIGRLAEGLEEPAGGPVPEERFAARYAQAYVDFIRVEPWYKFDFAGQLAALWREVPLNGPGLLRKWERRYLLTSELLIKEGYARLIKLGTQSIYEEPKPVTAVVITRAPRADAAYPDYLPLAEARVGAPVSATLPRYEGFTRYSCWLAAAGIDFVEVAGNAGEIVVSELVPQRWSVGDGRLLFEQPVLTRPGVKRVVIAVPVASLGSELRRAVRAGDKVEHVYDF